jgi:hypothetical protein
MRAAAAPLLLAAATAVATTGCSFFKQVGLAPVEVDPSSIPADTTVEEPAHVVVRHVLIAFDGVSPTATRSKDEAKRLAQRVLEEARRGRDFGDLVRLYSDDRVPDGKVAMANWNVAADGDEVLRQDRRTPRGYGAVAFSLKVGETAIVPYDDNANPLGWFVMRRIK